MESRPGCIADGDLRALVDDAVPEGLRAAWTRHLNECQECQARMTTIVENAGAVAAILDRIRPELDVAEENENQALHMARARQRYEARERFQLPLKGDGLMNRIRGVGRRGAVAGVAMIAVMVVVIAAVPLSSLADNLLNGFRVQQFSAITIPMDLVQPNSAMSSSSSTDSSNRSAMQAFVAAQLADLGKLNSTLDKSSLTKVSSVADAQSHLGGSLLIPTNLSDFSGVQPTVYTTNAGKVSYTLNVQKARELMQLGGIDPAPLPDPSTTPNVTISLDVPAGAGLDYQSNGKHLVVAQMESPTLSIPSTVDISMLRDEFLATGFLPPSTVSQLRAVKDWEHTLIIPIPSGATSSSVTVQGSPGLLIKADQGSVVLWQKDGILHAVGSTDKNVDVMSVASSLH